MPTNLAIDDSLLATALKLGGLPTKRETVNEALREFIRRREAVGLVETFGSVEYRPDYDYKKSRRQR